MEKSQFTSDSKFIKKILKTVQFPNKLDPSTLLGERKPEFECLLCRHIVIDPCQCVQCNAIFCKNCVRSTTHQKCSRCSADLTHQLPTHFNRVLSLYLNKLTFKCAACAELYTYEEYERHVRCGVRGSGCPLKC